MDERVQDSLMPRDCVMFSTADWDEPYWTNKQHTASLLASRGWRVLYVESVGFRSPKVGSGRDWARLWRRLWRGVQSLVLGPPRTECLGAVAADDSRETSLAARACAEPVPVAHDG